MTNARPAARRRRWLRWLGGGAFWFAVIIWGNLFRMPHDIRMSVLLWSLLVTATAGWGIGLWKYGPPLLRAHTWKRRGQYLRTVFGFIVGAAFLVGAPLSGLLLGFNGAFRSPEPFIVDGIVLHKYATMGRSTSYLMVVQEERPKRSLRFSLSRDAYLRTRLGDRYHEEFQLGLFGWPCRPR